MPHGVVLALVANGEVLALSIRITDAKFSFAWAGVENIKSASAGRDRFAVVEANTVEERELVLGNGLQWYWEWSGNHCEADYNVWIYAWQGDSVGDLIQPDWVPWGVESAVDRGDWSQEQRNRLLDLRRRVLINTVTVMPPDCYPRDMGDAAVNMLLA